MPPLHSCPELRLGFCSAPAWKQEVNIRKWLVGKFGKCAATEGSAGGAARDVRRDDFRKRAAPQLLTTSTLPLQTKLPCMCSWRCENLKHIQSHSQENIHKNIKPLHWSLTIWDFKVDKLKTTSFSSQRQNTFSSELLPAVSALQHIVSSQKS